MSFRIGQPVVCIDDSDQTFRTENGAKISLSEHRLIKGQVYTVKGIVSCSCGQKIDVGLPLSGGNGCRTFCRTCDHAFDQRVHHPSRFAPLEPLKEEMDRIEGSILHEQELQPA